MVEIVIVAGEMIVVVTVTDVGTAMIVVAIEIDVVIAMIAVAIVTEETIVIDLDRVVIRFFHFNIADLKIRLWDR